MTETPRSTISADSVHLTLINTFICPETRQNELVAAIEKANVEIFMRLPGFVSANVHASLDRTRVVNYVQWERVEDFDAAGAVPEVQEHLAEIMKIAESADPRLFHVLSVQHT